MSDTGFASDFLPQTKLTTRTGIFDFFDLIFLTFQKRSLEQRGSRPESKKWGQKIYEPVNRGCTAD
jgi:hypothetical protein